MTSDTTAEVQFDVDEIRHQLETDGIIARKGAFSRQWVQQLREDVDAAFEEARSRDGGAVGRGPNRWYVEIHPEALRGFVDLVDHPWVRTVCTAILGPDYQIVEVGFDTPFPGAKLQPWHRDFPSPPETKDQHRLTSLAFNLTTVDTTDEMGPFEIAPGTQWERGDDFDHEQFPPKSAYARYEALAERKYPQVGDISARSALTIHRGTPNQVGGVPAGAGARRGRAGRRQRRPPRPRRDEGLLGAAPAAGPRSPVLPRRRRAHTDHAEARHRGSRDGLRAARE